MSSSPKVPAVPAPAEPDAAPLTPRKPSLPKRTLPLGALFGSGSVPPPSAGRGPVSAPPPPAASIVPPPPSTAAVTSEQQTSGLDAVPTGGAPEQSPNVPDLPAGLYADDDPLADLFGDAPSRPTPVGAEGDAAPVARVELARPSSHGAAEEINATPRRDPRVDPSGPFAMPVPVPSEASEPHWTQAPVAAAPAPDANINADANMDADANIDGIGATMLAMAPPPSRPAPTADAQDDNVAMHGTVPDTAPVQPVRSMRGALLIIALVLVSGGVAVMVSLGVLGGSPTAMRQEAQTAAAARKAAASPPATTPPAAAAPVVEATPTPEPAPVAEVAPTPEEPAPEPAPAPIAEAAPTPEPTPAPTPVAETAPTHTPAAADKDPVAAGNALLRASQLDAAAEQFQAALTADPRDHYAMEGLARVAIARGDGQQAVVYAEQIVKRRAKRASYRVLLGQARAAAGDQAGAKAAFAEALALEPDNRDAARLLGQ